MHRDNATEENKAGVDMPVETPKEALRLFELASVGDLQSLRNGLCVYEIRHGKVFDLKVVNKYGVYLIHTAAYYGQKEILEFLLSSVSEVESADNILYEALITEDVFSFDSGDTEMGKSTETQPAIQNTPEVPSFGHAKPESSFINVRSLDHDATPLHYAAIGGNKNNIILYLLACGADPRLKDFKGFTPDALARAHGHKKTEKTITKYIREINKKIPPR
ncbi:hypothetical protein NEDG_00889 [Nematocida displodere]|uniref:Uncharacterized protein n=1 Tax=Nematocida displodere TaxID=1805483 RepID=A0A177EDF4_9MICR|nr:hypothetical protein NEDG_00889 [Nematocida displodere]